MTTEDSEVPDNSICKACEVKRSGLVIPQPKSELYPDQGGMLRSSHGREYYESKTATTWAMLLEEFVDSLKSNRQRFTNNNGPHVEDLSLPGVDLRGLKLSRIEPVYWLKLQKIDLRFACLDNCILDGVMFTNSQFDFCSMRNARIVWGDFYSGTTMSNACLCGINCASVDRVNFDGSDLSNSDFRYGRFNFSRFKGANLKGVATEGAILDDIVVDGETLGLKEACLSAKSAKNLSTEIHVDDGFFGYNLKKPFSLDEIDHSK